MQSKKNKRNLNRKRKGMQSNGLFGIKHIRKVFRVKMKNGEERNIEAGVWTIYEKSTGNQLANGKFSQMMDVLGNVSFVDPSQIVSQVEGEQPTDEITEANIERIEAEKEAEIQIATQQGKE